MAHATVHRPRGEIVYEHPLRALDGDGTPYRARVLAAQNDRGTFDGWLELVAERGARAVLRTERETVQATRDDVAYWASGLGALYLHGALERAKRRAGWTPPRLALVVREHDVTVVADDGRAYRPRTCARWERDGHWSAWIELVDVDHGTIVTTGAETSQPSLAAVAYWADGLEPIYFEGALRRAASGRTR